MVTLPVIRVVTVLHFVFLKLLDLELVCHITVPCVWVVMVLTLIMYGSEWKWVLNNGELLRDERGEVQMPVSTSSSWEIITMQMVVLFTIDLGRV